jgi:NAD(P)-dependent dehydrogenase (short-subunit alcohol dehydrogenase family)
MAGTAKRPGGRAAGVLFFRCAPVRIGTYGGRTKQEKTPIENRRQSGGKPGREFRLMDLQLKGKKALVTGSTAGIGFATARALAAEGASVIVNGRTQARVDAAVGEIRKAHPGADVTGVASDVSNAAGCEKLAAKAAGVEVLVNNMGIFEPKPFEKIPDADWLHFFEANVMSGVRLARHYLPGMRERNWGRILFVSSESAVQIPAEMIHYGMTKTAQVAVARGIAETVAGTGITVNSVLAGPTRSEGVETFIARLGEQSGMSAAAFEGEFFKSARPSSLLKRFATIEEVAAMIVYLSSPVASATTGAAVRVDGGVVRAIL